MYRLKFKILSLLFVTCCFFTCNKDNDRPDEITYEVTFKGNWSATNHPLDYPDNAHFSPILGMSHGNSISLFDIGGTATEGIEVMAETGDRSPLEDEIKTLVDNNEAGFDMINDDGVSNGTGSVTFDIVVDDTHSLVTLVTMLAPSPDWFAAVHNYDLKGVTGSFPDEISVIATVFDAGTDSGTTFKSTNEDTVPKEGISIFVEAPLGDGNEILPFIGTFTFTKK